MLSAKFKAIAALCITIAKEYEKQERKTKSVPQPVPVKENDKLLPLDKVMEILGVSDTTIYRYRKERGLRFIKVGKAIYIKESVLSKWLDENSNSHVR